MKLLKKKFNFDAIVLINFRLVAFFAASLISCCVNLFFIGNLSQEVYQIGPFIIPTAVFLCAMSITLEMSKLLHIVQYNTLTELHRKLENFKGAKKIKNVARRWLAGYLLYAMLAVVSATFFSFNSLGTAQQATDSSIEYVTKDYNDAQNLENTIASIQTEIRNLEIERNDDSDIASEFDSLKRMAERANDAANINWVLSSYNADGELIETPDPFQEEWLTFVDEFFTNNPSVRGIRTYVNANTSEWNLRRRVASTDIATFKDTKQQSIITKINQKTMELELAKADLQSVFENNDVSTFRQLENKYRNIISSQYKGGGTAAVFKLIGNLIGIDDSVIRCVLLLFLALLIELTIYQTSPKVQISRKMLFQFTQYLPAGFNVNKFMDSVDKELVAYDMIKTTHKEDRNLIKETMEVEVTKKRLEKTEAKKRIKKAKVVEPTNPPIPVPVVATMPATFTKPKKLEFVSVEEPVEEAVATEVVENKETIEEIETVEAVAPIKKPRKPRAKKVVEEVKEPEVVATPEPEVVEEKPVEASEPEKRVIKQEELKAEPRISTLTQNTIPFRFGRTSKEVMSKVIKFIEELYRGIDENNSILTLNNPMDVKTRLGLSQKEFDVFTDRLTKMSINGKFVLYVEDGKYKTVFKKDWLQQYVTEIVSAN